MRGAWFSFVLPAALGVVSLPAFGQSVISAQSGLVHYAEGKVLVADKEVDHQFGQFPQLKRDQVLKTDLGRAEVLLNPGTFLRVAENSSVRMLSTALTDCRFEFLGGSVVVEAPETEKGSAVTAVYRDHTIWIAESGIYRLDSEPAQLRVFDGEAIVTLGEQKITVRKGRLLALDGSLRAEKFDPDQTDPLDRWSKRRAEYISMANVSAARSIAASGRSWRSGGWCWNPYFGMFTYVPFAGLYQSPYAFSYWSPSRVYVAYERPAAASSRYGHGRHDSGLSYTQAPTTRPISSGTAAASSRAGHGSLDAGRSDPSPRVSGPMGGRGR
jgi:hypothetical protein